MKKLVSLIAVFLQFTSFAQHKDQAIIDSLLKTFSKTTVDTIKLRLLGEVMHAHVYYNTEQGLTYKDAALTLAAKTSYLPGTAKAKDRIGRLNWRLGNFSEALKYHFEALSLYTKAGDKYKDYVLVEIGQDYLDNGDYTNAERYLLKALQLSKQAGSKKITANTYDVLIYLYRQQNNTKETIKMLYESMKLAEEIGDKKSMIHIASNTGSYFSSIGNDTEALKYFKMALAKTTDETELIRFNGIIGGVYTNLDNLTEGMNHFSVALALAKAKKDHELLGVTYTDMGNIYHTLKKYAEAVTNYIASAKEFKEVTNRQGLAIAYYKMGISYTANKQYDLARQSFNRSKEMYRVINAKLLSMGDYYAGMEVLDKATGNWKGAYDNYKQFVVIKDSAFNRESLQKLVTSQMQFETDKKEAVAKALQDKKDVKVLEEMKRQRNIRNAAFAVLGIVLVFSGVVFYQRNKIAKEKKRSDQLLTDKELLLREIHHRVKNNLEVVSSLLALQSAQIDDPNTKEAMLEGQNRVQSIGIVHQKLYQGESLGAIEMKDYFLNLSESILDSFGADKRVTIECAMEKLNVDIDTAVPLGLIVNELLTNTLKYAFPQGQKGTVRIKLEKHAGNILRLEVTDNGIGKSGVTQGTGFGGQLISLLTRQLNGSMKEYVQNGTSIIFDFKLEKAA